MESRFRAGSSSMASFNTSLEEEERMPRKGEEAKKNWNTSESDRKCGNLSKIARNKAKNPFRKLLLDLSFSLILL